MRNRKWKKKKAYVCWECGFVNSVGKREPKLLEHLNRMDRE